MVERGVGGVSMVIKWLPTRLIGHNQRAYGVSDQHSDQGPVSAGGVVVLSSFNGFLRACCLLFLSLTK